MDTNDFEFYPKGETIMLSISKNIYVILTFNLLTIAFLSAIFIQKSHTIYPWHGVGMFIFNVCLATAIIISSYHVGKSLFNTKSNQILSVGFIFASVGFIWFSLSIVGYYSIIQEFSTPSFLINFSVFAIVFLIIPIFAAKPSKILTRLMARKHK